MSDRPHIVFVFSDQHNPDVIAASGDPHVRTPNLDRLVSSGVSLDNCYCASPWCVPSRMAMLTGRLPSHTGVFTNNQVIPSHHPTFAHGLSAAGYETVLCGRMHFVGMDQWHGFEKRLVGDITATMPNAIPLGYGNLHGATGQSAEGARLAGPGRSFVMQYDRDVTDGAVDFLVRRTDPRPLFLTVGHYGPHAPFICPRDLFAYYWERLPPPASPADWYQGHHPAVQRWMDRRGLCGLTARETRIARAAYYGLVEIMDRHFGRIWDAIDQTLGQENTLVIYGSDHGEMMGERGLFWKSNFYDGSVRVPLIFHWPGSIEGGWSVDSPASLLDLGPTLLNLVGGPALPGAYGRPLDDVLLGKAEADPDRAVVSMLVDRHEFPAAMIRHRQWKLVDHYQAGPPQLFNMAEDRREETDLGGDTSLEPVRRDLLSRLHEHWDPEAALEAIRHDREQFELIRAANAATDLKPPAQWMPSEDMNEIEPWP